MIIKRLRLHNFGVYSGDNEFCFVGEKSVVLVGGMNGRGKTTFLEAVLLALYGSNSFAYRESGQKSYPQYIRSFVNRYSSDKTCSVELEFETNNGAKERYTVKRDWDGLGKSSRERIMILKDGIYNEFLTNNWPMFVENIMPSALSSFFFFDGEKIAELAVEDTSNQLKESIRAMLGITVLDVLGNDIARNLKKSQRSKLCAKSEEEVEKLRKEKDAAIGALAAIDQKLQQLNKKLAADNNRLESLHQLYTAKGGDAIEKRQETIKKKATLQAELDGLESDLYDLIADVLPLLLVNDLISDIKLRATDEHTDLIMQEAVIQLDDLLAEFMMSYKGDGIGESAFVDFVKKKTAENQTEVVYGLSDQALFQTNDLIEGRLEQAREKTKLIIRKKRKLEKQINEFDSYLSLDINEKELREIYKTIKSAEQAAIEDQVKISELGQARASANSRLIKATSEFTKQVELYLSMMEMKDSGERILKYSNMALSIIEKYRVELQKKKTDVLAATITECYLKLANKKNLIHRIVMDEETLDIKYLAEDDEEIPKSSLSAGEQQLMVISILWALSICSKKKLPVIIDTPLSRLDSLHRTSLIQTYFPNAGEQTIILSTDSEINAEYYKLLRPNIGDEFTLEYDEKTKSTSIKRGYLIGEKS